MTSSVAAKCVSHSATNNRQSPICYAIECHALCQLPEHRLVEFLVQWAIELPGISGESAPVYYDIA